MVLSRLADGTIFEANEAFCELTGIRAMKSLAEAAGSWGSGADGKTATR